MDSYREDPTTYIEDYTYTSRIQKTPRMSRMLKSNPDPAIDKRWWYLCNQAGHYEAFPEQTPTHVFQLPFVYRKTLV